MIPKTKQELDQMVQFMRSKNAPNSAIKGVVDDFISKQTQQTSTAPSWFAKPATEQQIDTATYQEEEEGTPAPAEEEGGPSIGTPLMEEIVKPAASGIASGVSVAASGIGDMADIGAKNFTQGLRDIGNLITGKKVNIVNPDAAEDVGKLGGGVGKILEGGMGTIMAIPGAVLNQIPGVKQGFEKVGEFNQTTSRNFTENIGLDPDSEEGQRSVQAVNNFLNLVELHLAGKAMKSKPVQGAVKTGKGLVKTGIEKMSNVDMTDLNAARAARQTALTAENVATKEAAIKAPIKKIVNKRIEDLKDIESSYSKLRKNQLASKDQNVGSRERTAGTDVLVDSVDENGVIRTLERGGAKDQYFDQTLAGKEELVYKDLVREGSYETANKVRERLTGNIENSNLTLDEKTSSLGNIGKIMEGFERKYPNGKIPLDELHIEKIRTTQNIDYTNSSSKIRQKAIANAYKTLIEDKSNLNIRQVNPELAKYYQDLEYIASLDGRRVKGGRMGKHFAKFAGHIVGTVLGSTGGPLGAAVGAIAGGEVGAALMKKSMLGSFGKATGQVAHKSGILENAATRAGSPRLALPAPAEGAARSQMPSGKTINLPARSQSTIDQAYSERVGSQKSDNKTITKKTTTPIEPNPTTKGGISKEPHSLPKNLKITDAYGTNFLGFNMKYLEKLANEQNYPLYDKLITIDGLLTQAAKVKAMDGILSELTATSKSPKGKAETPQTKALVIDSDKIKASLPGYTKEKAPLFHEESSRLAKVQYTNALKNPNYNDVILTGGGSGSGKSELLTSKLSEKGNTIIYDGTLSNLESARKLINQAANANKKVSLHVIYTSPEDAWAFVAHRGRNVPREVFLQKHRGFRDTLYKIAEEYPDINIEITENNANRPPVKKVFDTRQEVLDYIKSQRLD